MIKAILQQEFDKGKVVAGKMMGKVIIGKVVGQFKNCACGKTQNGFCEKCKKEALTIIGIQEIESEDKVEMKDFLEANKELLKK